MEFKLALDWTPNINHIGFYVGKEKNFFKDYGIELLINSPETNNYKYSPAKQIELGISDFGLTPTESVISFRTKNNPFKLIAVSALFQSDISAIVVTDDSGIKRPKDLDGKSYASYGARYEDLIVKQLIKNDGGLGDVNISYPNRLGVWDTVSNKTFDSTWIFMNWEGIEKPNFNFFKLSDYNIPYSYSPLIVCSEKLINTNKIDVENFLKATKKSYMYCLNNVDESIKVLYNYIPKNDKKINLRSSLNLSKRYFGNSRNFGKINYNVFLKFFNWLKENGVESKMLNPKDFYVELNF
tara:strand:- start:1255 stop:2145 length:891 start_codon:yes stop_codon:yes gene_type:complete